MKKHGFNFNGGDLFSKMGATWFISYSYYEKIDNTHLNWRCVSTWEKRKSTYNRTREYHEYWIKEVLNMDNIKLQTNKLGIVPKNTKKMAEILYKNFNQ
ncbi:MAG: hypothetical protein IJ688_12695 [Treponema sp.]|nr:hypothetical protein [Treponema sp.]